MSRIARIAETRVGVENFKCAPRRESSDRKRAPGRRPGKDKGRERVLGKLKIVKNRTGGAAGVIGPGLTGVERTLAFRAPLAAGTAEY
jgi:hypothetical protein